MDEVIPQSWGICGIMITADGIAFRVAGSKLQTEIKISTSQKGLKVNIGTMEKVFYKAEAAFEYIDEMIE